MPQRTKKHEHEHRHPDTKRTISELLAAGQGSAIMPGDIMEKLYDHKEAERLEEEKRATERRKSKKKRKKKAKKVSRYVLESDSESDREFLEDRRGKESSSGESDVQSADEEDALDKMYGPQSKHGKRRELERKKKQLEADAKKRRRNRGEEAI